MQTTQHGNTRCPIYLHPAACSSPAAVEAIQRRTGLLVITTPKGHTKAIQPVNTAVTDENGSPFGGSAA